MTNLLSKTVETQGRNSSEYSRDVHEAFSFAAEEAVLLNHNYVGSEHLLFGVIKAAPADLAQIFQALGLTTEAVEAQIKDIIGAGTNPQDVPKLVPSLRVRTIVEGASSLAENRPVDSSYIILALCREYGVSAQILNNLGIENHELAEAILRAAGKSEQEIENWITAAESYDDEVSQRALQAVITKINSL